MPRLILGADIGGTSTRLRLTRGEIRVAERNGGGCNIRSSGTDAAGRVADLLTELAADARAAGEDLASVEAAVLGVAGAGPARHAEVSALLLPALVRAGVPAGVGRVVDDQVTAFTAGAGRVGADGFLLLAGTGAAAARFEQGRMVARADGMGWLLGDCGSAVDIGRRVLRAAAADLDHRGPATVMTARVLEELGIEGSTRPAGSGGAVDVRQALIQAADPLTPAQWGRFARIPGSCAGDVVAQSIIDGAASDLVATLDALGAPVGPLVVLAGALLAADTPIARRVEQALAARGLQTTRAAEPVVGALLLAQEDGDGSMLDR